MTARQLRRRAGPGQTHRQLARTEGRYRARTHPRADAPAGRRTAASPTRREARAAVGPTRATRETGALTLPPVLLCPVSGSRLYARRAAAGFDAPGPLDRAFSRGAVPDRLSPFEPAKALAQPPNSAGSAVQETDRPHRSVMLIGARPRPRPRASHVRGTDPCMTPRPLSAHRRGERHRRSLERGRPRRAPGHTSAHPREAGAAAAAQSRRQEALAGPTRKAEQILRRNQRRPLAPRDRDNRGLNPGQRNFSPFVGSERARAPAGPESGRAPGTPVLLARQSWPRGATANRSVTGGAGRRGETVATASPRGNLHPPPLRASRGHWRRHRSGVVPAAPGSTATQAKTAPSPASGRQRPEVSVSQTTPASRRWKRRRLNGKVEQAQLAFPDARVV